MATTIDAQLGKPYLSPWGTWIRSSPYALDIEVFGPPPGIAYEPEENVTDGWQPLYYKAYLRSREWGIKSAAARERAGYACERCGSNSELEVHHKHYRMLGNEKPEDLEVLCPKCHVKADDERKQETTIRKRRRRIDAYASAKYGEDWAAYRDRSDIADELEDKS